MYAIYKNGDFSVGNTIAEVIDNVCTWRLEERELYIKINNYKEQTYHSYSEEYTDEQMYNDAVKSVFSKLKTFGFTVFISYNL